MFPNYRQENELMILQALTDGKFIESVKFQQTQCL